MISIQDVVTCVRVMEYAGVSIHYTSGICKSDIKVSALDCFMVMRKTGTKKIGYVVDLYDMKHMLEKAGVLSTAISETFTEEKILYYLENEYVPLDIIAAVAEHYGLKDFRQFLLKAKDQIYDLGCYIGEDAVIRHENKKQNTDQNLSNYLDLDALGEYADFNAIYPDTVYIDVCDTIAQIVFGDRMEDVRYNLNLYTDDYLSDHIHQEEYDEICFLCRVMSYLMKYSDISMEGMGIFCNMALRNAKRLGRTYTTDGIKDYQKPAVKRTENNKPVYDNIGESYTTMSHDEKDYSHYEDEYGDDPYYAPIKKNKGDKDIRKFKDNM